MHLHDVLIGRFGKSHGVKGFVVVHSYTEKDVDIMNYQPWLIGDKKKKPRWMNIENIIRKSS